MTNRLGARSLVFGLIAAGMLLAVLPASAQQAGDRKTLRGPVGITPDAARPGSYSVKYTDYTYVYFSPGEWEALRQAAGKVGLSDAALLELIRQKYRDSGGKTVTAAEVSSQLEAIYQQSKQAIFDRWRSNYGSSNPSTYGGAGAMAFRLAQELANAGIRGSGANLVFDGAWGGAALSWARTTLRGWPLEAAMIHSPEFTSSGTTIDKGLLLEAWDVVWGNASARGFSLGDPLVLDLDGNGRIDVTGRTSAKYRAKADEVFVRAGAVRFDLLGTGQPVLCEWVRGKDGFLVDNRKNRARQLVAGGKNLTTANLFGDVDGHPGGFVKLAREFFPQVRVAAAVTRPALLAERVLSGKALEELLVWVDNGDGRATVTELRSLASLGISEIRLPPRFQREASGEIFERSTFVRNGKPAVIQEVWFAHETASDKGGTSK